MAKAKTGTRGARTVQLVTGERLMFPVEVAALLQCHARTVHRLIKRGELRAVKVGREYRIRREDYEAYLDAQATQPEGSGPAGAS